MNYLSGQTEVIETTGTDADDFLARERAVLGEDADQFATPQDRVATATVDHGDDDLLGGGDGAEAGTTAPEESAFESSFPAIETHNEVLATPECCIGETIPEHSGVQD